LRRGSLLVLSNELPLIFSGDLGSKNYDASWLSKYFIVKNCLNKVKK
jgi:hypothetical protein